MKSGCELCTVRFAHLTDTLMHKLLYLGLDAHARSCVLAAMNTTGRLLYTKAFTTSQAALISHVVAAPAHEKQLVLEESALAGWIADALRPYVDKLIVCDPRQNALISRGGNKDDYADAHKLCRLLRLGELTPVYHSDQGHRVDFKIAVQQYLAFRRNQASLKAQIKAKYHQAGVVHVAGTRVFSKTNRTYYLKQLPSAARQATVRRLYTLLDAAVSVQKEARAAMIRLGRRYPEIQRFMQMPGIGEVSAHVFDAFIQTPHRFATKQKLWRYCKLGVRERSSSGKLLAYKRLDRSGSGALKAVSYQCWLSARKTREPNEVSQFYETSLIRTGNPTAARLNTQRKVLLVLWTIWKHNVAYNPHLFVTPARGSCVRSG